MTPELHAMLSAWLEGGDETQRRHAAARLAMPDAIGYEPPSGWEPPAPDSLPAPTLAPLSDSIRAVRLGFRQCFYSDSKGCGCTGTHCFNLGRVVGLADCISCLSHTSKESR